MNIAVFDLETNGYPGTSVLSASSIVFDEAGSILSFFNRFYLPTEPFNRSLFRIHGLTPERLTALRGPQEDCSPYFIEDWPTLLDFWERWDARGVVIHNATFDMAFLPDMARCLTPCWCSMRGLTKFCELPKKNGRGGGDFKWPRLAEAVDLVCCSSRALPAREATLRAEEAVADCTAHVSLSDCFELYRAAARVSAIHPEWMDFQPVSANFRAPKGNPCPLNVQPREDDFTAGLRDLEARLLSLGAKRETN